MTHRTHLPARHRAAAATAGPFPVGSTLDGARRAP